MTVEAKKVQSKISKEYYKLNEESKGLLREAFKKEHEFSPKSDIFYRKINGDTPFYKNEKKWLAEQLKTSVKKLFPEL